MQKARKIDAEALRTLSDLDRILRRHIQTLIDLPCESDTAAQTIALAIDAAETALAHLRETKRQVCRADD